MSSKFNPFPEIFKQKAENTVKRKIQQLKPESQTQELQDELKVIDSTPVQPKGLSNRRMYKFNTGFQQSERGPFIELSGNLTPKEAITFKRFLRDLKVVFNAENMSSINIALENLSKVISANAKNASQELINIMYQLFKKLNEKVATPAGMQHAWFSVYVDKRGIKSDTQSKNGAIIKMTNIENMLRDALRLPEDIVAEQEEEILNPNKSIDNLGPAVQTGSGGKKKAVKKEKLTDLIKQLLK